MSKKELRDQYIAQIAVLAGNMQTVAAMLTTGAQNTEPGDLKVILAVAKNTPVSAVFAKLNLLITNELRPERSELVSRDRTLTVRKFFLPGEVTLTVRCCELDDLGVLDWHRVIFDSEGIDAGEGRVTVEPLLPEPEPVVEPEPEPVAEPAPAPVPEPAPVAAQPEPVSAEDDYWKRVNLCMRTARHAIGSGSVIRANEVINELRTMLIELICRSNGVNENFGNAIDFIEGEDKEMLLRTYPQRLDQASMISAMAVISQMFDKLA